MSKLETIAQRPDRILVKTFRPVSLPGVQISQSKFISDKDQLYCVIGQKTFHSPLYTHFVVIDSHGNVADDQMSEKVYEKISRLNIIQYIQKREIKFPPLPDDLSKIERFEEELSQEPSLTPLLKEGEQVAERFRALERETTKLFKQQEWQFTNFKSFDQRWRRFWRSYEERLKILFEFRENVIKNGMIKQLKDESIQQLFHEANEMYQLFVDMVPLEGSLFTKVNHLITINFELGHTKTSRTRQYVATAIDLSIYYFVRFGFIISLVLVLWTLFRLIFSNGSIVTLLGMIILMMFFLSVRVGNQVGMLRLVEKGLKDLRAKRMPSTRTIDRHFENGYKQMKQTNYSIMPSYSFVGTLVKVARWMSGIGVVLFIVGFFLLRLEGNGGSIFNGYMIVGLLMLVIGLIMPRLNISKRTIQLTDNYLHIGKRSYTREDVIHIRLYDKAHRIKVKLRTHPDPITYRIDETNGQEINSYIKTWCDIHFVNYK